MSFENKTWYNKDENGNIPDGAPRFDADNMNRIEKGIDESLNGLAELLEYTNKNIKIISSAKHAWIDNSTSVGQIPNWSAEDAGKYQVFAIGQGSWSGNGDNRLLASRVVKVPFDVWITFDGNIGGNYNENSSVLISGETGDIYLNCRFTNPQFPILVFLPAESLELI